MHDDILEQGFDLMLYGMGTVVVFLTLLVVATLLMSRLVLRFFPEPVSTVDPVPEKVPAKGVDERIKRVITLAIEQHRKQQGR